MSISSNFYNKYRPLSYSENLAQLISKIDFLSEINEKNWDDANKNKDESNEIIELDNDTNQNGISSNRFFQSISEKLK